MKGKILESCFSSKTGKTMLRIRVILNQKTRRTFISVTEKLIHFPYFNTSEHSLPFIGYFHLSEATCRPLKKM